MKYAYCSLVVSVFLTSALAFAEEPKKIFDNIRNEVVELCSTDPDGTVTVAIRCKYDWLDMPFVAYRVDQKQKRAPSEVTEIITPVDRSKTKNSKYGIFKGALVHINYGLADGRSSIYIYTPSDKTPHKFSAGSGWMVATNSLGTEVDEVGGFKKGDKFCLKQSPTGYPNGIPVIITRLFNKDNFAIVDTESKGLLGMGNTFSFHLTSLSNLVECADKITLDPNQVTKTSAPTLPVDIKINNRQAPKIPLNEGAVAPALDNMPTIEK